MPRGNASSSDSEIFLLLRSLAKHLKMREGNLFIDAAMLKVMEIRKAKFIEVCICSVAVLIGCMLGVFLSI